MDNKIARESRRANKKVANKRITMASLERKNAIQRAVTGMLIDPFSPKQVGKYIVNSAVENIFFNEDRQTSSRK